MQRKGDFHHTWSRRVERLEKPVRSERCGHIVSTRDKRVDSGCEEEQNAAGARSGTISPQGDVSPKGGEVVRLEGYGLRIRGNSHAVIVALMLLIVLALVAKL